MADKNTGTLFQVRQAGSFHSGQTGRVFSFRSDGQGLEQGSSEV